MTLQEDEDFKSKALGRLKIKPNAVKSDLPELERQIKEAQSPRREASIFLQAAGDAQQTWEAKRQSGARRVGHRIQDFITKFASFVRVYAGFIDLIRQSNGGYAEAAYSTLSLFFMVRQTCSSFARQIVTSQIAIKKSENDTKFADTLETLQNSFPRMTLVEELYPEPSVKTRVSKVYREIVLFARVSFEYFANRTWRKFSKSAMKRQLNACRQDRRCTDFPSCSESRQSHGEDT